MKSARSNDCAEYVHVKENLVQMHCTDQDGYKNIVLSIESQELGTRNRLSEESLRSELCSHGDHQFKSRSREHQQTDKRCRQSDCERIFRTFPYFDDVRNARYPKWIRRMNGRNLIQSTPVIGSRRVTLLSDSGFQFFLITKKK